MRGEEDKRPVGILVCAQNDPALVEYALAGMGNPLFGYRDQAHPRGREPWQRALKPTHLPASGEATDQPGSAVDFGPPPESVATTEALVGFCDSLRFTAHWGWMPAGE